MGNPITVCVRFCVAVVSFPPRDEDADVTEPVLEEEDEEDDDEGLTVVTTLALMGGGGNFLFIVVPDVVL